MTFFTLAWLSIELIVKSPNMDVNVYEAQADTIDVDDIARNSNNRIVMRRIKRNNADDKKSLCCKMNTMKMTKNALIMFQKGLMIWNGWGTLLVKMNICRS